MPKPPGPFRVDQLKSGDPYELSEGHAIEVMPTGSRGARRVLAAGAALASDPAVTEVGTDVGHALSGNTLRAPNISVGNAPDVPGWVDGAPLLAVEFADRGRDEADLTQKIAQLLAAGTLQVWIVRLTGAARVEVHAPGAPMLDRRPGEVLALPGVLANPMPVDALFDVDAARRVAVANLLHRDSREEGFRCGLRGAILHLLHVRGVSVDDTARSRLHAQSDTAVLLRWLAAAATAERADDVLRH